MNLLDATLYTLKPRTSYLEKKINLETEIETNMSIVQMVSIVKFLPN